MWARDVDGKILTLHIAGVNNQNFVMRDDETGSYWQQVSGKAISGPLKGKSLRLIHCDELTFALWKTEQPRGTVMKDVAGFAREYSPEDWDVRMKRVPTVITHAEPGLAARDLARGVGDARQAVLDEQDSEALVAKVFGERGRQQGAAQAQIRGVIGRNGDHRGTRGGLAAHVPLDEIGNLARALADEPDHDDVGFGAAGDHVDQHRLADARAGHDPDALADAERG